MQKSPETSVIVISNGKSESRLSQLFLRKYAKALYSQIIMNNYVIIKAQVQTSRYRCLSQISFVNYTRSRSARVRAAHMFTSSSINPDFHIYISSRLNSCPESEEICHTGRPINSTLFVPGVYSFDFLPWAEAEACK